MSTSNTIRGRYQIKAVIGKGGMGVVYRAFDQEMRRDVAVKTLLDVSTEAFLDLFYRECDILRGLVHPNVVDILDMGEYEDEGVTKPYYVMPLLPGLTLYDLLHPTPGTTEPLSVDRGVEIITQTSRGLHAAHEHDLLHRDVKPRNIFVIDEYSVKLIDFGVAHMLNAHSATGIKGTLEYMAPEQLRMKPLTRRIDIYSLATVCYEILTGTHPFRRPTEGDTASAILNWHPPLAHVVNPNIPKLIGQVISKGMAKDPQSRFATAAEFADTLSKARRNESLTELFNPDDPNIRLERARQCLEQRDYQFAAEILQELETEGYGDTEVRKMRERVEQGVREQTGQQLYESAARYFQAEEYLLVMRKVHELLDLDPRHAGALELKTKVESRQKERRLKETQAGEIDLKAQQEISARIAERKKEEFVAGVLSRVAGLQASGNFAAAHKEIEAALSSYPGNTSLTACRTAVDAAERDEERRRERESALADARELAVRAAGNLADADIDALLAGARKLAQRHSGDSELYRMTIDVGQALLDLRRSRAAVDAGELNDARALAHKHLERQAQHAGFLDVLRKVEERERQIEARHRESINRRIAEEPDLERRVAMLEEARRMFPAEPDYAAQIDLMRQQQAQVRSLVEEAAARERAGEFLNALDQWNRVREIHGAYPGLASHKARLTALNEEERNKARVEWARKIGERLDGGDCVQAAGLLEQAEAQFPGEFPELKQRAAEAGQRRARGLQQVAQARDFARKERWEDCRRRLKEAAESAPGDPAIFEQVIKAHGQHVRAAVGSDWKAAAALIEQAISLDPAFQPAEGVRKQIADRQRAEIVQDAVSESRKKQRIGQFQAALDALAEARRMYPDEHSLTEQVRLIEGDLDMAARKAERQRALQELDELEGTVHFGDESALRGASARAAEISHQYAGDKEVNDSTDAIREQVDALDRARRLVAEGRLDEARRIADEKLAVFVVHPAFARLLREIQEAQERAAAADLAQVMAALQETLEWEPRERILRNALKKYPGEGRYKKELDQVVQERKMVAATVERARAAEKAGAYRDALEQWERVRTAYRFYPQLDAERARVHDLLDGQLAREKAAAEAEAEARVKAEQEEKRRREEAEAKARAEAEARAKAEQEEKRRREEAEAKARAKAEQDEERRREEVDARARAEAEARAKAEQEAKRREEGEAKARPEAEARTKAEQEEKRRRDEAEAERRHEWERILAQITAIESQAPSADLAGLRQGVSQLKRLEKVAGSDEEAQARVLAITQVMAVRIRDLERLVEAPPHQAMTTPEKISPGRTGAQPGSASDSRRKLIYGGVAAAGAILAATLVISRFTNTSYVGLTVKSPVAGAAVEIGGQSCVTPACNLRLKPGSYTLTATKAGYQNVTQAVALSAQQRGVNVALAWVALPQILQVSTNFESGIVLLDGSLVGNLRDGQYRMSGIAAGTHTLRVTGGGVEFQAQFKSQPGSAPELLQPVSAKEARATVVSNLGGTVTVACNCEAGTVTVDGNAAGQISAQQPQGSRPIENLREGTHQIAVDGQQMVADIRANPTLGVFLSNRNKGTLVVETGQDGAQVYLNNRLYHRLTESGMVRIPVDAGTYSVRVEKEGYPKIPPQTVEVAKGAEKQMVFSLASAPAMLEITGAVPGALVKVEGQTAGKVEANGTFRGQVAPGVHDVELSSDGYRPVKFQGTFLPGGTVHPVAAQVAQTKLERSTQPAHEKAQPAQPQEATAQHPQSAQNTADADSIRATVIAFAAAYSSMDLPRLQTIWPSMPQQTADSTSRQFQSAKGIAFQLQPVHDPVIDGNSATVTCVRHSEVTPKQGQRASRPTQRVRVTLERAGSGWVIRAVTPL